MTSNTQLKTWLENDDPEFVAAIGADIRRHVDSLRSAGDDFYGYAVLPGDYCTQVNAPTFVVAFNRESDIAPENADDVYYRYSVDEWSNYVLDGFDATNSTLKSMYAHFKQSHSRANDSFQIDEFEITFIAKLHRAVLGAMLELKNNETFVNDTYLIIWISDSDYEIMDESAKALNRADVYERYASEFE